MILAKRNVWVEANSANHHVCIVSAFACFNSLNFSVSNNLLNSLTKLKLNALIFHNLLQIVRKLWVEVAVKNMVFHVNKGHVFTKTLEGFSKFDANVASTKNHDVTEIALLQFSNNSLCILEKLYHLHVFQVNALNARLVWKAAGSENQLVVRIVNNGAVFKLYCYFFLCVIDVENFTFKIYLSAFFNEIFWLLVEQSVAALNLLSNPQSHAATKERNITILIVDSKFVAWVAQNGVSAGSAGMVGANLNDLRHR